MLNNDVVLKEMSKFAYKLVGLTTEKARERCLESGVIFQIRREDGKTHNLPTDVNSERVRVEVDKGKVTKAQVG